MNMKKMKKFFTLSRRAEGFTLIELIVVIAILAILGGVAVPAYSGYVKKAERANDEALLSAINKAFASTCMMHGENNFGRKDVNAELNNGSFAYTAPFADTFAGLYEGGTFKVFEGIIYNAKDGMFVEASAVTLNIYNILKDKYGDQIAALMASNLGAIGSEGLLTEVGSVVDWAANTFDIAALGGDAYWNAVLSYVGLTDADFEGGFGSVPEGEEYAYVLMALKAKGMTEEEAGAMLSNSTALYAAQSTKDVTLDSIKGWMGQDTEAMQNSASGNTLANAGAIYGLYMAYAESKGEPFNPDNDDPLLVMDAALSDPGFTAWLNSPEAETELTAYKASMEIVDGATTDESAKNAVLTNGFDDPELITAVESAMGN